MIRILLYIFGAALLLGLLIALLCLLRTLFIPVRRSDYKPAQDEERALKYASKLSEMIRCDTTSYAETDQREVFLNYHKTLEKLFPLVHEHLEKTEIDGSLLFKWKGENDKYPLIMMGHQDVVPVQQIEAWTHGPFSGAIDAGKVWGRGAVDDKGSCMTIFQAVEELLQQGYTPKQDTYISTSCTEELSGDGCPAIVAELKRRGVKPWLVIDEGGGIYTDPMMGIKGNFAMIGVGEKGRGFLKFTATGKGGHGSTPQKNSPVIRLAKFICAAEKHSPFPSQMSRETRAMLEALAPSASFPIRLILENLWFFRYPIMWFTPAINGQAAAMLGSTLTFTMMKGSDAGNVIPQEASVTADIRSSGHQNMAESIEAIRKLAAKYGIETEIVQAVDGTKRVDIEGDAYEYVKSTVSKTFPGCVSSPYVLTGGTDAFFYDDLCDNCIRFTPLIYGPEEKKGIHGIDEALRYDCLPGAVDFYIKLIRDNHSSDI